MDLVKDYLSTLNKPIENEINKQLKKYAADFDIPIIKEEGLFFIRQMLLLKKPMKILEIGTAIGYSAINMAHFCDAMIHTIEKDKILALEAIKNIELCELQSRIKVFIEDATKISLDFLEDDYDLIFIDAAKSKYQVFFERYSPLLKSGGMIIADNLVFHNLVVEEDIKSRNLSTLVKKIKNFNDFIVKQNEYDTVIYNIGDGMSLSIKK